MAKRSDGIFVFVVLALAAFAAQAAGLGGLGSGAYTGFAPVLLVAAGGFAYFMVKDAGEFGIRRAEGALAYAGIALVAALSFAMLLLGSSSAVLGSVSAAIALACAAPLAALWVRSRAAKEDEGGGIAAAAGVGGVADAAAVGKPAESAGAPSI